MTAHEQEQAAIDAAVIKVRALELPPDAVLVVGIPGGITYAGECQLVDALRKVLPPSARAMIQPAEVELTVVEPAIARAGAHEALRELLQAIEARGHEPYADTEQLLQAVMGDIAERIADLEARC